MNSYVIIVVIILLIAIFALIYFSSITRLKDLFSRMDKAEEIIDTNLNKKLDLIIALNNEVKKATGKKDYLKDYVSIRDLIITNNEKDFKLDEAVKLINDLMNDYSELSTNKEFNKKMQELREIDEVLTSAKNLFNQNAVKSNQLLKTFPYNIISKITKYHIRSFYNNNKTDDNETF